MRFPHLALISASLRLCALAVTAAFRLSALGLVWCVLCLLWGSGCGKKEGGPVSAADSARYPLADPPMVSDCPPGVPGGRLVVATFGDPKTFNPITENESSSRDIVRFLFAGLTDFDWPSQSAKPGLAESWQMDPDQRTWTFKLRRGLHWSDGHPLTADDVVFTWQDVIYNTNIVNVTVDLFRIDGKDFVVSKVDDTTVRVVTPNVYAPFIEYFGGVAILPKHILAAAVAGNRFESAYGINAKPEEIVCSGPYRLKQFKPGERTVLERNPYFYVVDKQGQRLPYLEQVIYTVVPDMNAMSLRFLSGESDVHETVRPDEYERFQQESPKGGFSLYDLGVGPEKAFLWFNLNTGTNPKTGQPYAEAKKLKWFRQTKFRQAIAHSLDRPSIIKSIYAGRAQVNSGFISSAIPKWVNSNVVDYPFNPTKARALLKEIGIEDRNHDGVLEDADGNVLEFVLNTNTGNNVREKVAVLIQDDLKRLGVKLIYQPVEFKKLVDKIDVSFDYDCILLGLAGGGIDPAANMNVLKSDGFTHFWSPRQKTPATEWEARIDFLMNAQLKTTDHVQRKKHFDEVQEIMSREMPFIYTVAPFNYAAIRNGIANVRPTVLSSYRVTWNAEELYWKKK